MFRPKKALKRSSQGSSWSKFVDSTMTSRVIARSILSSTCTADVGQRHRGGGDGGGGSRRERGDPRGNALADGLACRMPKLPSWNVPFQCSLCLLLWSVSQRSKEGRPGRDVNPKLSGPETDILTRLTGHGPSFTEFSALCILLAPLLPTWKRYESGPTANLKIMYFWQQYTAGNTDSRETGCPGYPANPG